MPTCFEPASSSTAASTGNSAKQPCHLLFYFEGVRIEVFCSFCRRQPESGGFYLAGEGKGGGAAAAAAEEVGGGERRWEELQESRPRSVRSLH